MKVLRVLTDGADRALADEVGAAFAAFNRGLDIRLRFLSIGVEEQVLEVGDAAAAAESVDRAIDAFEPGFVVLDGSGEPAVAAATAAVRRHVPLVVLRAGRRTGPDADAARAVDRIATVLVAAGDGAERLADEGLDDRVVHVGDDVGRTIIATLRRLRQRGNGGAAC